MIAFDVFTYLCLQHLLYGSFQNVYSSSLRGVKMGKILSHSSDGVPSEFKCPGQRHCCFLNLNISIQCYKIWQLILCFSLYLDLDFLCIYVCFLKTPFVQMYKCLFNHEREDGKDQSLILSAWTQLVFLSETHLDTRQYHISRGSTHPDWLL